MENNGANIELKHKLGIKSAFFARWSFGVVLYEMFTFGDTPYANIQKVDVLEVLLSGERLSRPTYCSNEV